MIDIKDPETFILIKQAVWEQMYKKMSLMMSGAMLDTYYTDENMVLMVMFPRFTEGLYIHLKVPLDKLMKSGADIGDIADVLFDLLVENVERAINETRHDEGN